MADAPAGGSAESPPEPDTACDRGEHGVCAGCYCTCHDMQPEDWLSMIG